MLIGETHYVVVFLVLGLRVSVSQEVKRESGKGNRRGSKNKQGIWARGMRRNKNFLSGIEKIMLLTVFVCICECTESLSLSAVFFVFVSLFDTSSNSVA